MLHNKTISKCCKQMSYTSQNNQLLENPPLFPSLSAPWFCPLTPLTSPPARLLGEINSPVECCRSWNISGAGLTSNRDGRRCFCDSSQILRSSSSFALFHNTWHLLWTSHYIFIYSSTVNLNNNELLICFFIKSMSMRFW
jgi:hypothetical protein